MGQQPSGSVGPEDVVLEIERFFRRSDQLQSDQESVDSGLNELESRFTLLGIGGGEKALAQAGLFRFV
ncbi:MAG TPA: hypothetical protein PKL28_00975 [Rhodocyclaceae bacterium]|nr:hypothetical protein [Rhodocyclaceae bacterium]